MRKGIHVLKKMLTGVPLLKSPPEDFSVLSLYDTMKVYRRGVIELNVPQMTWWCPVNMPASPGANVYEMGAEWSDVYESKIAHNRGYVPMHTPALYARAGTLGFWGQGTDPDFDSGDYPYSVVDLFGNYLFRQCSVFGWGGFHDSITVVFCDDTYLYLRYAYILADGFNCILGMETDPVYIDAVTLSYPYTIFYNQADEKLNLHPPVS